MSYITDIYERANLQQIQSFLCVGTAKRQTDRRDYQRRVEQADEELLDSLRTLLPDREAMERVSSLVCQYGNACQDAYMEMGMQVGALLAVQLLHPSGRD